MKIPFIKRFFKPTNWKNLRSIEPISRFFGFDRGTPIDRVYIEHFLSLNRSSISGIVCEISDDYYSKKFGMGVVKFEIFSFSRDLPNVTIAGDLTQLEFLPKNSIDCFIATQTLNFIYDYKKAIEGIFHMLKEGGVTLVTVSGISQISRYDMDRWGDFWRFTPLSIFKVFEEVFGVGKVEVSSYGNVLAAVCLLEGISAEELTHDELFHMDKDYPITITIKGIK